MSWLTRFLKIVSHAVHVRTNVRWALFLRATAILSTLICVPSAALARTHAPAELSRSDFGKVILTFVVVAYLVYASIFFVFTRLYPSLLVLTSPYLSLPLPLTSPYLSLLYFTYLYFTLLYLTLLIFTSLHCTYLIFSFPLQIYISPAVCCRFPARFGTFVCILAQFDAFLVPQPLFSCVRCLVCLAILCPGSGLAACSAIDNMSQIPAFCLHFAFLFFKNFFAVVALSTLFDFPFNSV